MFWTKKDIEITIGMVNLKAHEKYVLAWKSADAGEYHRAMELVDEAIELSPNSSILWVSKAQFLADINELCPAIKCAKKSVSLNSRNHHAYVLLGLIYKRDGNTDEAIKSYKQALSLNKDYGTLTLLALAELEEYPSQAIAHAKEALSLNPDWEEAYDVLCRARELV